MNSTLKRTLRRFWSIALLALSPLFFWQRGDAAANTLWVNDDASVYSWPGTNCDKVAYATIQAAINAASAGDTIRVCPGIYNENLLVNKRYLSIISTSGVNVTTIKAHLNQPVVQVLSPNFTLEGFSLIPEGFAKQDIGVNLAIEGTSNAQIVGNIITRGRIGINGVVQAAQAPFIETLSEVSRRSASMWTLVKSTTCLVLATTPCIITMSAEA